MSIKDFTSVTATIPIYTDGIHQNQKPITVMFAEIEVERDEKAVITIRGSKNANALLELILTQQLVGLSLVAQPAQPGFPSDEVEVTTTVREGEIPSTAFCPSHDPVQHRDGKQPWCNVCGMNAVGNPPSGNKNLRIGDSISRGEKLR